MSGGEVLVGTGKIFHNSVYSPFMKLNFSIKFTQQIIAVNFITI